MRPQSGPPIRSSSLLALVAQSIVGTLEQRVQIIELLACYGETILRRAFEAGTQVVALAEGQGYRDASRAMRRHGVNFDSWPHPPQACFIVEERTLYLRRVNTMTVLHEFGHAIDATLGDGVYYSLSDPFVKREFRRATGFVTPYAASALDEFFAEAARSMVAGNSRKCTWPNVSRERLRSFSPNLEAFLASVMPEAYAYTLTPDEAAENALQSIAQSSYTPEFVFTGG